MQWCRYIQHVPLQDECIKVKKYIPGKPILLKLKLFNVEALCKGGVQLSRSGSPHRSDLRFLRVSSTPSVPVIDGWAKPGPVFPDSAPLPSVVLRISVAVGLGGARSGTRYLVKRSPSSIYRRSLLWAGVIMAPGSRCRLYFWVPL